MLDLTVAYKRYRFLGDEFLTWIWYLIETDQKFFTEIDSECSELEVGSRMVLENRKGKSLEKISIKGDDAGLEEGKLALRKGALVSELSLIFKTNEDQWTFSIKGESLNVSGLKVPASTYPQHPEEMEDFLLEKSRRILKILIFIEKMFKLFIKLRISNSWESKSFPDIKKWFG
jgi:hypothetical protein